MGVFPLDGHLEWAINRDKRVTLRNRRVGKLLSRYEDSRPTDRKCNIGLFTHNPCNMRRASFCASMHDCFVMWVILFMKRIRNFMKTYYWQMKRKNGSLVEGKFSLARRLFGRAFLGETYQVIGEWK